MEVRFTRLFTNQDTGSEAIRENAAAIPGRLADLMRPITAPLQRESFAAKLAQFLREDMRRAVRISNDFQVRAALDFLFSLTRLDEPGQPKQFYRTLAQQTETALLGEYCAANGNPTPTFNAESLSELFHARALSRNLGPNSRWKATDADFLCTRQDLLIRDVRRSKGLMRLDEIVRATAWTGFYSVELQGHAPTRAQHPAHPWQTIYPSLTAPSSDALVAKTIRREALSALKYATDTNVCPTTIASLHMLATNSSEEVLLDDPQDLWEIYEQARLTRKRIVVDRTGFQDHLRSSPARSVERRRAAQTAFRDHFGCSLDQALAEVRETAAQIRFTHARIVDACATGQVKLYESNRYQDALVTLLVSGQWHTAEQLFRGTAHSGVYDLDLVASGLADSHGPFSIGRRWLLRLAIIAMFRAQQLGQFGIAAALGQVILDDYDGFSDKMQSVAGRLAYALAATECGQELHSQDERVKRIAALHLDGLIQFANQALLDAIKAKQPVWLQQV